MNKVLKKVLAGVLALTVVVGIVAGGVVNSKASAASVTTKTFAENEKYLASMSEEDFMMVFGGAAYAKEFSRNYSVKTTRGGDNMELIMQLLLNLTVEEVDKVITTIYNKLPKFVQKFVTEEKLRELIVEFIEYVKNSDAGQEKIDAAIKYLAEKTKVSETIIKIVVELVFNYITDVIEGGGQVTDEPTATVAPTAEITAEPTIEPTVIPTAEVTVEPTETVTVEPTVVPAA